MVFVELAGGLRTEPFRRKLQHLENNEAARSVRAHLVADADRLTGAYGSVIDFHEAAFARIVRLSS